MTLLTNEDYNRAAERIAELERENAGVHAESARRLKIAIAAERHVHRLRAELDKLQTENELLRAVVEAVRRADSNAMHDLCYCDGCEDERIALVALAAHDAKEKNGE